MRVKGHGINVVAKEIDVTFNGQVVKALEGETVAASLTAAGKLSLRQTKAGSRRGIFCGMGVCNECLVAINGQQNIRACMTTVKPGMRIEEQTYPGKLPGPDTPYLAEPPVSDPPVHKPDVLVIGGGPAGLQAAKAAAKSGCQVVVIDERPALGGQYFKQLSKTHAFDSDDSMDKQFRAGRDLIREVEGLGVKIMREAMVWGAFGPQDIAVFADGKSQVFEPKQLVVATGAYERGVPVPGWTLPGYMTTGAAQTLLRSYRVSPGKRVILGGNGPLNIQVAYELTRAGVEVVAVVEAAPKPGIGQAGNLMRMAVESPDLVRDGITYTRTLKNANVPILYDHVIIEARGEGKVETAVIARLTPNGEPIQGTQREFKVDAICVGFGFQPSADVSRPLGCRHHYDAKKGTLTIETDANCQTSVPGVFVAGDSGGMGGSRAAQEQGFIAGCAAARGTGRTLPSDVEAELARRKGKLGSHLRFQAALWDVFKAPRWMHELAREDTLVCRCEEVTLGQINQAFGTGIDTVGGIKRQTRAGMGRCQGRYCGPVMTHLQSLINGQPTEEFSFFAPRPPIKPVPIAALARKPADA